MEKLRPFSEPARSSDEDDICAVAQKVSYKSCFIDVVVAFDDIKRKATKVIIGLEPSGHYWKPLTWFLKEQGYQVVLVNPFHVKKRKEEEDNSPTKNDRKDALIIAKLVKGGKFLNCLLPEGIYADLRNLSVARKQLINKLNSVKIGRSKPGTERGIYPPSLIPCIPGIGIVTVAGFLAEVGDLANYTHFKQIQKLAGLNVYF